MTIKTAQDAIETYKTFDGWKYADREAVWKWMFERGREAQRDKDVAVCLRGDPTYKDGYSCAKDLREQK